MIEALQVGQFAIVDHEPVDRGPNAGVFRGKGPADDRAELYVVAEGTTPAGESFAGHAVSAAGQAWQSLDMSVTGALTRIIRDADQSLRDWNQKSIVQHRVAIGVSALARRGDQVVLAQAGPSIAFHLSAGRLQVYEPNEAAARALGLGVDAPAEPSLVRIPFRDGDRVLLITSSAVRDLDDRVLADILALPTEEVLGTLYRRVRLVRDVTALLVASGAGVRELPPVRPGAVEATIGDRGETTIGQVDPSTYQPSLFLTDGAEHEVAAARQRLEEVAVRIRKNTAHLPALADQEPGARRMAAGAEMPVLNTTYRPMAAMGGSIPFRQPTPWRSGGAEVTDSSIHAQRERRRTSFARTVARDTQVAPPPSLPGGPAAPVDEMAEEFRARPTTALVVPDIIEGDLDVPLPTMSGAVVRTRTQAPGRWKPQGTLSRRVPLRESLPPTRLIVGAGLVVLLVLVGAITLPRLFSQSDSERYARLVDDAQLKLSTSRAVQDPSEKRTALVEAQALLFEARDLSSSPTSDAGRLLLEVNEALKAMDAITAPASVDIVANLEQFGSKPIQAIRLAVGSEAAYVLDAASNQVILVSRTSDTRRVVFGEDREARRGRPQAMAYVDGGDEASSLLLIVDSNKTLWTPGGQAPRQLTFTAPDAITDIAVFGRELYLLDAPGKTIWRASPIDGGYGAPVKVLSADELGSGRRLTVDREDLFVTAENGNIRRIAGRVSIELSEAGIDTKLTVPDAVVPFSKDGQLAILDGANDRIVILRSDGAFDRQYQHKDFTAAGAFTIYQGDGFIFSGGRLRKITW